jgi:hypothetical protein
VKGFPCLYFDKDQMIIIGDHEINLTSAGAQPFRQNVIAPIPPASRDRGFRVSPTGFGELSWL